MKKVIVDMWGDVEKLSPIITKYMRSKGYEKVSDYPEFAFEKGKRRSFYIRGDFKDKFFMFCFVACFIWGMYMGYEEHRDIFISLIASSLAAYVGAILFKWRFGSEAKWALERMCDFTMGSKDRIYVRVDFMKNGRKELFIHTYEKKLEWDAELLGEYLKTVKLPI